MYPCRMITRRPDTKLQPTWDYLRERILRFSQLVRTKFRLSVALCNLPIIQERRERVFLPTIKRPTIRQHINL